jgi:RNA polymerase sigma-70 factor (ECF subfamily)
LPTTVSHEVTQLLVAWSRGDRAALDQLMPMVYAELRRLARHYVRQEYAEHTLQPTALIHEAYLRLIDARQVHLENRAHFFAIAARLMRQILVDFARERGSLKRGGSGIRVSLEKAPILSKQRDLDMVALDEALSALAEVDGRKSQVVEMRFFGGLTEEEIAAALDVSPETVRRDWRLAKSWLRQKLSGEQSNGA